MTSIPGSFTSNQTALQSTPWWGNGTLAKQLATAGFNASPKFQTAFAYQKGVFSVPTLLAFYSSSDFPNDPQYTDINAVGSYAAVATPVPFDFDGGTIPAVVGAFVLAARWKARRSIASKTRTANPDVAVR